MVYSRAKLVVLMYADNNCYTNVFEPDDPKVVKTGVTIDEKNGTWTAPHPSDPARPAQTKKIGEGRYFEPGCRHGVIGVFDHTKIEHLSSMLYASREATNNRSSFDVD